MKDASDTPSLKERLELIETMIREGRRGTQSWGWIFVLWGVALYVAVVWASWGEKVSLWGEHYLAWPVTMVAAVVLMMTIAMLKEKRKHDTRAGHMVASVWTAVGITMFVLFPALSMGGRLDPHIFAALIAAMLGIANGASGMILRWRAELACAVAWWTTAFLACFGTIAQVTALFLAAIFLCQIVFGVYAMILDSRRPARAGEAHA